MPRRPPQHRPANWRPPARKIANPYYSSKEWRALRAERLALDGYRCTAPGCTLAAVVVDHLKSRALGGADSLANTRSLCRLHDNQIKERADGRRRRGGQLGNDMAQWLTPRAGSKSLPPYGD